jgi:TRAP-type C4-dicarboxylate transport system substrate-binding protein
MRKVTAVALGIATIAALPAGAKELKVNNYMSPRSMEVKAQDEMIKEITKATNGSLTGKVFVGGQLLSAMASLGGLRDGVVDVAFIGPTFHPKELRHAVVIQDLLPYAPEAFAAAGAATETTMLNCPKCRDDWHGQNAVFLGSYGPTPWHLMCAATITGLRDLKGKKVRVTGNSAARMVRALGMIAVNLTPPEIAPALQGGQIECAVGPLAWLYDLSLSDTIKTVIDYPIGVYSGLGLWTMNKRVFDGLTGHERKAVMDEQPRVIARLTTAYRDQDGETRQKAAAKGIKFAPPGSEFVAAMDKYRADDIANIVGDLKSRGVEDADEVVKGHLAMLTKWKELVANGTAVDSFASLLQREVYSKLHQ